MKNQKITHGVVIAISALIIILIIFKAGEFVGYKKAGFYERLEGEYPGTFGKSMLSIPSGHGVTGKVLKISLPNLVVEGPDNIEKTINISTSTLFRHFRNKSSEKDIKIDDKIVIIGSPADDGKVDAKLIRILSK